MPQALCKMDAKSHKLHLKTKKILTDCGPEIYAVGYQQDTPSHPSHWDVMCFSRKTAKLLWAKAISTTAELYSFDPGYFTPRSLNVCNNQIIATSPSPVDAYVTPPEDSVSTVIKCDLGANRSCKLTSAMGVALEALTTTDNYTFVLMKFGVSVSSALVVLNSAGEEIDSWEFEPELEGQLFWGSCVKGQLEVDGVFRVYVAGAVHTPGVGFDPATATHDVFCLSVNNDTKEFTEEWSWSSEVLYNTEPGGCLLYLPTPKTETLKTCYLVISQIWREAPSSGESNGRQTLALVHSLTDGSLNHSWEAQLTSKIYNDIWSENPYAKGALVYYTSGSVTDYWVATTDDAVGAAHSGGFGWAKLPNWSSGTYQKGTMCVVRDGDGGTAGPYVCLADTAEIPGSGEASRKVWGKLDCMRNYQYGNWYLSTGEYYGPDTADRPTCALQYKDGSHYLYFRATSEFRPAFMYKINLTAMTDVEEIPAVLLVDGLNPHIIGLNHSKSDANNFSKLAVIGSGGRFDAFSYLSTLDVVDIELDSAILEWDRETLYKSGDECFDTDTLVYISLTDNSDKKPSENTTDWMTRAHSVHPTTAIIDPVMNREIKIV